MVAPQPSRLSDAEVLDAIVMAAGRRALARRSCSDDVCAACLSAMQGIRVMNRPAFSMGSSRRLNSRGVPANLSRSVAALRDDRISQSESRGYSTGGLPVTAILETGERVAGRMLLLATGLVDELPQIENFRQFYGSTVHNCPYCDGWECRGQQIAVTGCCNQESLDLAIELLLWSKDLVLCTNGALTVGRKAVENIKRLGIRIIETPIALLEGEGDTLEGIRFTDGSFLPRSALFFSPGQYQRHLSRNSSVANFAREITAFSVGKTPRRTSLAFMPREMPAAACSSSSRLRPKVCRSLSPLIALDADADSNALRDHEPGQPTPSGRITPGNEAVD